MAQQEVTPRLQDVARQAGVSLATASRVLSGSQDRVSPSLRERVLEAAAELHYVPNAHAQALVSASTSTVGLIVHDVSDPYFSEIARGVLRVASGKDLLVLICNTYRDPDRELEYVSALRAQRVRGVLLAGSGFVDPAVERRTTGALVGVEAVGGRAVMIGRHRAGVDSVLPDNVGGARLMGNHLVGLGHRTISVVAGPPHLTTIEDRLTGFRQALAGAGIELPDTQVVETDFTRDGGYDATRRILDSAPETTAIFALNDAMAIGVLAALRERGISVPDTVSVVGFDDIPIARDVTPALTTMRLPMELMGARAMDLALRRRAKEPRRVPTDSSLVARDSAAPPPRR
ncbi:MAG: LacI family DNA-binding transcriptional regulator [Acidimicrobiales bacterium]